MRRAYLIAAVFSLCLAIVNCGEQSTAPGGSPPPALSEIEQQVVASDNAFGLNLFRDIAAADEGGNVFISPLSVSMALGMTLNGARGTTLEAMTSTMEMTGLTMHEIDSSYRSIIDILTGLDRDTEFAIANSIWYRKGKVFRQEFLDTCTAYFDAEIRPLDFSKDEAADTINEWVEDKTKGKIPEIIGSPIGNAVVMYLINAIYFLGIWQYEFDPGLTADSPFYLEDGSTITCSMMRQPAGGEESYYRYLENERFQAIDLPYGNGYYSMTVFLPRAGVDVDALIGDFTAENWDEWMAGFGDKRGAIFLPKFELDYELLLNDALIRLGMGIAFMEGQADFTGMREDGGLFISNVIHKTYVRVDEEGTEAAAVTVVEMAEVSIDSFVMKVDRPFIFAIREKHSDTILFIGRMMNPTAGV